MYVKDKFSVHIFCYRIQEFRNLDLNIKLKNWVHKISHK